MQKELKKRERERGSMVNQLVYMSSTFPDSGHKQTGPAYNKIPLWLV
jgi:hypothetical protein